MANAYWVSGGNGQINSSTNWSTTSGGPSGYSPVSTDDLIVDANSLNAPMTTVTAVYNSLTFSGYIGNLTLATSTTLTISQTLIYSIGMTTSGTGALNVGSSLYSTASINFNGVTHSGAFNFNNGSTTSTVYTITGDMNIIGTTGYANSSASGAGTKITLQGAGRVLMNSGMSIFGNGNRWLGGGTGGVSLHFVGTGSGNITSGVNAYIFLPITFEKTSGTINMTVGAFYSRNSSFTYISGNFTNLLLSIQVGSCTLNTAGMSWSTISISSTGTLTNNSLCTVTGTFTNSISSTISGLGHFNLYNLTSTNSLGWNAGVIITVSNNLSSVDAAASPSLFYSRTSGSPAYLILGPDANQDVAHTNATDINSAGGQTIYSYRVASLIRTVNWATLPIITSINTNTIVQ